MEFLILLVVLVAVLFWVKKQFPDAGISKYIGGFLNRNKPLETSPAVVLEAVVPVNNDGDKHVDSEPVIDIGQSQAELQEIIETPPVETAKVDTAPTPNLQIPEDSVLKRHYLAKLEADRKAITHPYPTDSILRRHYESLQASYLQKA